VYKFFLKIRIDRTSNIKAAESVR